MNLLERIYKAASLILPYALIPVLLSSKRGRSHFPERYGSWKVVKDSYTWFHGASMGEVRGLLPIMRVFKEKNPNEKILLSATSLTGLEIGKQYANASALLPFDNKSFLSRALEGLNIKKLIIAETELWPIIIEEISRRGIPITMVNARISKYSFPRYKFFKELIKNTLAHISNIFCIDEQSRERFLQLGASTENVLVVGNTKYDSSPTVKDESTKLKLKNELFSNDYPIFVLGSLRPGEEAFFFPVLSKLIKEGAPFNCVVAPRHQERFTFFEEKLKSYDLRFKRWSEKDTWDNSKSSPVVILLDAYGILESIYSVASLAFIGATLVDIGGHNPLEAAAYGTPVMMGPHVSNVEDVCESLQTKNALCRVESKEDIERWLRMLINEPLRLLEMGGRAREVWAAHFGTVSKVYDLVFGSEGNVENAA